MSQTETNEQNSPASEEERIRKIYAKDLKVGESIHTVFKATRKERLSSRAGKPYLVIGLVDRTGEVDARVFDNVEAADSAFTVGDYLLLAGKVGHFHGHPQIIIERLERLDPEPIDGKEFAYTAPPPSEKPEKPERAEKKAEEPGGHKAARQRIMRMLDNPQVAQALDVLVTHLERYIDERIAQKTGQPPAARPEKPERKPRGPKVEHKARADEAKAADAKPSEPKREALPDGLAFKPFTQLVGDTSSGLPESEPSGT